LIAVASLWQRVVYERPSAGTLQRGLVAMPRGLTVAFVLIAVVALVGYALRERVRARRTPNAPRHPPR
jgi:hypothetical protein